MLLFLDNAREAAQVEPLLPRHERCAAIITSRRKLTLKGLSPIDIDVIEPAEGTKLALALGNRRDSERLTETHAERLVELCARRLCGLPHSQPPATVPNAC